MDGTRFTEGQESRPQAKDLEPREKAAPIERSCPASVCLAPEVRPPLPGGDLQSLRSRHPGGPGENIFSPFGFLLWTPPTIVGYTTPTDVGVHADGKDKLRAMSPAETELLRLVWQLGEATVQQVCDRLPAERTSGTTRCRPCCAA